LSAPPIRPAGGGPTPFFFPRSRWRWIGPDDQIHLAHAALLIAAGDRPDLDVDDYLGRLSSLAEAAEPARRADDALGRLHRLREYLFESSASRETATTTSIRATAI